MKNISDKFALILRKMLPSEIAALVIAVIFIITGIILVFHPAEMRVEHPVIKGNVPAPPGGIEYISKGKSQVYGVVALGLGVGLGFLALYSVIQERK